MLKKLLVMVCLGALCLSACQAASPATPEPARTDAAAPTPKPLPATFPFIEYRPAAANWGRGAMTTAPTYDPNSEEAWQMDLRSYDLSVLDLRSSLDALMFADFDDRTVWPLADRMPPNYDWQRIMELGKNPGLGIRSLHNQGITGRGVGIAIIDQPLLVDHQEYTDRLQLSEAIDSSHWEAAMHGAAVASISVGKTIGVAPEADLYFIDGFYGKCFETPITYHCLAQAVRRILQINAQLPPEGKIRVISIARGYGSGEEGSDDWKAAMLEAKAAGLLVVSSSIEDVYRFKFHGLGRDPLADPDQFDSYEPGLWWAKNFYANPQQFTDRLLIPMDSRTTASPTGNNEYVFYRQGGWSWSIPYIAGVYALAAQVDPTITPDRFWELALRTGRTVEGTHNGQAYTLGPIIDPVALIAALGK